MESYWTKSSELPIFPTLSGDATVDVAIIGAGITGITTAFLLKQSGVKVALLERGRCAGGDTGATTAHLTHVTDYRLNRLVNTFGKDGAKTFWEAGLAAIDKIHDFAREESPECEFKWVPGYLHARLSGASDQEDRDSLHKDAELARELGFKAEFVEDVPYANRCGIRFDHQAKFHPLKYLAPLLKKIPGNGSFIFENTEAHEIEGEDTITIKAGRYKIRCKYLVIATHTPLQGKTGLIKGMLFQSKLSLYTSYAVGAKIPRDLIPEGLYWDTEEPYHYLRTDKHRDFAYAIFGGEDVKTGQEHDVALVLKRLRLKLKAFLPQAEIDRNWLGQVVETNDGLPYIGESAEKQFIATGFSGNGITLGTVAAMMAHDQFLGRINPWTDLFSVNRKKFHGGTWRYLKENADYPYYLLRERFAKAETDSLNGLKSGEGAIIKFQGKKVAAYRNEEGQIILRSPVCTHLGCIVRWNKADKTWDCPCHGSRFSPEGEVHSGPAESPLAEI